MTDFYQTLGVPKGASDEEIKRAYRTAAMRNHPDRGGDVRQFQTIQEAYDTLSDPQKRQQYDNPQPQFQQFGGPGGGFHFQFGGGGDPFADIMNQFFGQQVRQNLRVNLEIDLDLAATGGRRAVGINGQNVEIEIPEGVNTGDQRQYAGLGGNGLDLVVQFRVRPHAEFERRGNDLYCVRTIDFWDMILGTTLNIRTIKGDIVNVAVPARTRPGAMMRVRGHGILGGSILVELQPMLPNNIPDELVEHIRAIRGN
jgi:DnaJ-class molecular chaperone